MREMVLGYNAEVKYQNSMYTCTLKVTMQEHVTEAWQWHTWWGAHVTMYKDPGSSLKLLPQEGKSFVSSEADLQLSVSAFIFLSVSLFYQ